jgi:N-acetylglucosaminyldiphosphoundecaprenol N-acetyl-beta-D-mannosaminyltransferase
LKSTNGKKVKLFGVNFDLMSPKRLSEITSNSILEGKVLHVTAANTSTIIYSRRDSNLKNAIECSDYVTIDGMPIVWVLRALGVKVNSRLCGPDIYSTLINLAQENNYRIFLLGATEEVITSLASRYAREIPNLNIVGYRNGYFLESDEIEVVSAIIKCKPDILFIGISSPKKDIFLRRYKFELGVPLSFGVGGLFDIEAGIVKRAPLWMQASGFEWFYRILQEPKRMLNRYLYTNSVFLYLIIKALFRGGKTNWNE